MKVLTFDHLIAMNLLGLGVLTLGYGVNVLSDIPSMSAAISQGAKLRLMNEVIEFEALTKIAGQE